MPEPAEGDFVEYVLDGQQRLTALFASLKGLQVERDDRKTDNFRDMYIDLKAKDDEQIVMTDISDKDEGSIIRITDLLLGKIALLATFPSQYQDKLDEYRTRLLSYNYSTIQVREAPLDIATEIFTRINVGGKPLTLFEIMVAKTFEPKLDFDLSERFERFIEDLKPLNYETIPAATILQTISLLLDDECKRQTILRLDKTDFINIWSEAIDAVGRSVEYFKRVYRIPVSQLLPYNALIVPFAYFFYRHPDKPTGDKQKYLEDFFWRCSLSGRYSSGVEGKLAQDVKRIDKILKGELPAYDWGVDVSTDFIDRNGWFSAGRSYIKAILCIYTYQQPQSFNDNSLVNISNYWLKQANSKNYHHFFPKAHLRKKGMEDDANHIVNITIVDDFLNKKEIRAQAPSEYMRRFQKQNPSLAEAMKSHLITDLDRFGVWDDDYDLFWKERAKAISNELRKRIIAQDVDKKAPTELIDDYDEESPELLEMGR